MRHILSVALLATAVGVLAVVPSEAAKRGKNKTQALTAASFCETSGMICCPGSCPTQSAASVAQKYTKKARSTAAMSCPVSDPSACPSTCPREAATVVAANATRR